MKIVAIGGGEIGRDGKISETGVIDREIVALTNKPHPKLVFIPSMGKSAVSYSLTIQDHFTSLGCIVEPLILTKSGFNIKSTKSLIASADIIYCGAGNTLKIQTSWRKLGLDRILISAAKKDKVMCGLSAGAVCWFAYASSDSRKLSNDITKKYIRVRCLNLLPAIVSPHFDTEALRKAGLKKNLRGQRYVGIGIDEACALEIIDNRYRVLSSLEHRKIHKSYWKKNKYIEEDIEPSQIFHPISKLFEKE